MALKIMLCEAAHDEKGNLGYDAHLKGDQTEDEVRFKEYYPYIGYNKETPWVYVFRPIDPNIANAIAIRMEEAARNPHIGYGQPSRHDIHDALAKNPSPAQIKTNIDCDCSSLVNSVVWVTLKTIGVTTNINGYETTALMPQKYLNEKKYFRDATKEVDLVSGNGLKRGDILCRPASHTAVVTEVVEEKTRTGHVTTDLYLRKGAGILYGAIAVMKKGETVTILDEVKTVTGAIWYKVQYGNQVGYCSSKYIA